MNYKKLSSITRYSGNEGNEDSKIQTGTRKSQNDNNYSNSRDKSMLVIASYPPKYAVHHPTIVGGASYTKNTLLAIQQILKSEDKKWYITVLAEKLDSGHSEDKQSEDIRIPTESRISQDINTYEDNGSTVKRLWKRHSLLSFFNIAKEILHRKNTTDILFSLELAMFGGKLSLIGLMFLLVWLKLLGKKTFIVCHQVITDISEFEGHLGTTSPTFITKINNAALRMFYKIMLFSSYKTIVFEETFKEYLDSLSFSTKKSARNWFSSSFHSVRTRLSSQNSKIIVIPHGVEDIPTSVTQAHARQQLHIPQHKKVILLFGFLAWYKGTDWIVDIANAQQFADQHIQIIIAGGANPNRLELPFYQDYIKRLTTIAEEKNILLTGFVPEDEIALYFQAADLVIFPYRALMSSSGPLSLAFTFNKPFLLSNKLKPIIQTADMQTILREKSMTEDDITFPLTIDGLTKVISIATNNNTLENIQLLASYLKQTRSWENIGKRYLDLLEGK